MAGAMAQHPSSKYRRETKILRRRLGVWLRNWASLKEQLTQGDQEQNQGTKHSGGAGTKAGEQKKNIKIHYDCGDVQSQRTGILGPLSFSPQSRDDSD
ncbi:hypothetical protein OJAV_G00160860 [Oryzias javanicus]|uniref:Uncharacterized protein n=1 Tax=Oryzias javanicus TaxID=123683 RepID=A0A3S2PJN8_ORYJA|nr:hypothetical protein OJAV_G00160860 [Oryzias javanicus]